ncbi:transposase-like protein [Peribacillus simplex]
MLNLLVFIRVYSISGLNNLTFLVMMLLKNAIHTLPRKLDVLNYMNEHGTFIRKTAAIFNIPSYETLRKWKVAYETEGFDALQSKKKGRPSMKNKNNKTSNTQVPDEGSIEALQAENERLRMENAYLKKLNALVQNKEKSPNKTKHK